MNKYLLIGVAGLLVIAGGWWCMNKSNTSPSISITDTAQQNTSNVTGPNVTQPNTIASKPGWKVTTSQQLGVRFENPADASISAVEQRKTTDGTTVSTLAVTPKGTDPTIVHFFTANVSLEQAKNIQFYRSDISNSEFVDAMIDSLKGIRRIDHFSSNECTNELTVVEKEGKIYGLHIVQCPTHPTGYDQLRRDIATSLVIL
jgi:hypothetical protein